MNGYLGEFEVDIKDTPYANYTPTDWAMVYIERYGQIDGAHHKTWVLDQVVRIMKGTPIKLVEARWKDEEKNTSLEEYRFWTLEPSKEYLEWVEAMKGEVDADGETEYGYDVGIAP